MKKMLGIIGSIALALFWVLSWTPVSSLGATDNQVTIKVGGQNITYDQIFENDTDQDQIIDHKSYYLKDNLVLSAWDSNKDGREDIWFVYDEAEYLTLEAADLDFNGEVDELTHIDRNENVTKVERPGNSLWNILWPLVIGIVAFAGAVSVWFIRTRQRPADQREVSDNEK